MANTIDAFLERFTAATGDYNKAVVGELSALDAVYLNVRPEVARQGQTIRVPLPDVGAFTDQSTNDWTPDDVDPGYVDVTFGERPGKAILIRDFEQFMSGTDILDQLIDPCYKRAQEYANGKVLALATTSNFNAYPAIQSTSPSLLGVADVSWAWSLLTNAKVPLRDSSNASLLYHVDLHRNTLTDTTWYQQNLVASNIAQDTRQNAARPGGPASLTFDFNRKYDQQAITGTSANLTGTVSVTNGSATITGSSSKFTSDLSVGSWVTIGTDTVSYPVASIASDTSLTLAQNYGGTTASGKSYTRRTYTSLAMHKFAIALVVRPLEIVNDGHVRSRLVMMRGLPMRLMLSYVHTKAAYMLTLDYGMVATVIRPNFGVIVQS